MNRPPSASAVAARARKWDRRLLDMALMVAGWSKDGSRKIGCVIVGPQREIRTTGYNGFPRGVNDEPAERHQRPAKYLWTVHAEANAIFNAARVGIPLEGCTIYMAWYPCAVCAGAIVQAGIKFAVLVEPDWEDPKYGEEFKVARDILTEGGVWTEFVQGYEPPVQKPAVSAPVDAQPLVCATCGQAPTHVAMHKEGDECIKCDDGELTVNTMAGMPQMRDEVVVTPLPSFVPPVQLCCDEKAHRFAFDSTVCACGTTTRTMDEVAGQRLDGRLNKALGSE